MVIVYKQTQNIDLDEALTKMITSPSRMRDILIDSYIIDEETNELIVTSEELTGTDRDTLEALGLELNSTLHWREGIKSELSQLLEKDLICLEFHPGYPGNNIIGFLIWQIAEIYFEKKATCLEHVEHDNAIIVYK